MQDKLIERGDIYERTYRRLNPRFFPYSPYERQRELRDLWPQDRRRFRDMVDAVLKERAHAAKGD